MTSAVNAAFAYAYPASASRSMSFHPKISKPWTGGMRQRSADALSSPVLVALPTSAARWRIRRIEGYVRGPRDLRTASLANSQADGVRPYRSEERRGGEERR